eukprot:TRINITY_DN11739_c0_g1_i1.p1 TRINITY_DN11739_c0_g1~~TRINITY_DN11739_c0_g1_i1.p1  ORF type:complete len:1159 (+),score=173.89 TRINITY_DN11739_c0_g1_i1:365-3841(+)
MSVGGMSLPLMSKQKPKILVYDEHDVWPHVEDATTCPSSQPQLHPVKLPSGKKYLIKRLVFSYDCSGVYIPEIRAHSNPYLHVKVINVDLITDFKSTRLSLEDWVVTLQGEAHLVLLVHPTLVQQPKEALRESERKLGIMEGLFHKKRPIEQAKQKLTDAEGKLKGKFSLFTLHPGRDPADLTKEIRNCVFSSFDSRLKSCCTNASRLRDSLIVNQNICPCLAAVDEVGQILHQFGLTEEAYAQYHDLSSLFSFIDENPTAQAFSFAPCSPPSSPCSDDKDVTDHKSMLFPVDVSKTHSMFSFTNVNSLRDSLRSGDITKVYELEARCFVFALQATTHLAYHKDIQKIYKIFRESWLPDILNSFKKRGAEEDTLCWLEMSLLVSFMSFLEGWEKDREERKRLVSASSSTAIGASVNSQSGSPVGRECVSGSGGGAECDTPPTLPTPSPTPSVTTGSVDGDAVCSTISMKRPVPRAPLSSSTKSAAASCYADLITDARNAFVKLGGLCGFRVPKAQSTYTHPVDVVADDEDTPNDIPILDLSEMADEAAPLGFVPLRSQTDFEMCYISMTMLAVHRHDLAGHVNMVHSLEFESIASLVSRGYCIKALQTSLSLVTHYTALRWNSLMVSAKRQVLTCLAHMPGDEYQTNWSATAMTLIGELQRDSPLGSTPERRLSESKVIWELLKKELAARTQPLSLEVTPTFDFDRIYFEDKGEGSNTATLIIADLTSCIPDTIAIDEVVVTCTSVKRNQQKNDFTLHAVDTQLPQSQKTSIKLEGIVPKGSPGLYRVSHIRFTLLNQKLQYSWTASSSSSPAGSPSSGDVDFVFCGSNGNDYYEKQGCSLHRKCHHATLQVDCQKPIVSISATESVSERKHLFSNEDAQLKITVTKLDGVDALYQMPSSSEESGTQDTQELGGTIPMACATTPGFPPQGIPSQIPSGTCGFLYLSAKGGSALVPPALMPSLRLCFSDDRRRSSAREVQPLVCTKSYIDMLHYPDQSDDDDGGHLRLSDPDGSVILFDPVRSPEITSSSGSLLPIPEVAGLFAFVPNDPSASSWVFDIQIAPSLLNKSLSTSFIHVTGDGGSSEIPAVAVAESEIELLPPFRISTYPTTDIDKTFIQVCALCPTMFIGSREKNESRKMKNPLGRESNPGLPRILRRKY